VYRRLAADVLEPSRLEKAVPLSNFARAALPDPDHLRGRDWARDVFACPADVIELRGGLEAHARLMQRAGDELLLLATLTGKSPRATKYFSNVYLPALAAVDSLTTAEGSEFVPTTLSGATLERIGAALTVAELFQVVPMLSGSHRVPGFSVTPGLPALHPQQTADTSQTAIPKATPTTNATTLTAAKLAIFVLVSAEAVEDAIASLLGALQVELSDWLAAGVDDAIINGDTTGTHMDGDVTAATDHRKAFAGLRKLCPSGTKTDGSNGTLTAAMLRVNRKKLGNAGSLPAQLAHIVSPVGAEQLTADSAFFDPSRNGPNVTQVAGEVGRVDGVPVAVSNYVRTDLNASGVYDGTTTNRSVALTVNHRGFLVGQRRGVTLASLPERYAEADQHGLVASLRVAFASTQASGFEPVAMHYNLATT
jgi:hypothetical protein